MRPKERIPIFFELIDWEYLSKRWGFKKRIDKHVLNHIPYINVSKYWLENPDQRIGQILINLELIPDKMNIWLDEEWEILRDQGIAPEEFLMWTSYYDKDMKPLEKPKTRLIKDMCKSHIENVIKNIEEKGGSFEYDYNKLVKQAFDNMLNKESTPIEYE